jgi:hypothetical protein
MRQLRYFWKLRWCERSLLLYTFVLLTMVRLGLRFLSFEQLQRVANGLQRRSLTQPFYSLEGLVWAINICTKYMPGGAKCLARALTVQHLLRWQGYPFELVIGVAKGDRNQLEAHAWVTSEGRIVVGWLPDLERYRPLGNGSFKQFSLFF